MSPEARMEYLESIVIRYRKASKNKKQPFLTQIMRLALFGLTP